MAWHSILPGQELPDPKGDAAKAVSFGPCRVSERAIYLPGREYLPLTGVRQARLYASRLNTRGCCGLGIPVWYVLVYYGGEGPLKLLAEKRERAEALLARLAALCPDADR